MVPRRQFGRNPLVERLKKKKKKVNVLRKVLGPEK